MTNDEIKRLIDSAIQSRELVLESDRDWASKIALLLDPRKPTDPAFCFGDNMRLIEEKLTAMRNMMNCKHSNQDGDAVYHCRIKGTFNYHPNCKTCARWELEGGAA